MERYHTIETEFRGLVPDQLIDGLHVYVGIPSRDAGAQALDRVRAWLPPLAVHSPFWRGAGDPAARCPDPGSRDDRAARRRRGCRPHRHRARTARRETLARRPRRHGVDHIEPASKTLDSSLVVTDALLRYASGAIDEVGNRDQIVARLARARRLGSVPTAYRQRTDSEPPCGLAETSPRRPTRAGADRARVIAQPRPPPRPPPPRPPPRRLQLRRQLWRQLRRPGLASRQRNRDRAIGPVHRCHSEGLRRTRCRRLPCQPRGPAADRAAKIKRCYGSRRSPAFSGSRAAAARTIAAAASLATASKSTPSIESPTAAAAAERAAAVAATAAEVADDDDGGTDDAATDGETDTEVGVAS